MKKILNRTGIHAGRILKGIHAGVILKEFIYVEFQKVFYYEPGDRISIKHRCVALLYSNNSIERCPNHDLALIMTDGIISG
jgi:hypothetical protein